MIVVMMALVLLFCFLAKIVSSHVRAVLERTVRQCSFGEQEYKVTVFNGRSYHQFGNN